MAQCGNRPGIYIFGCFLMYLASLLYLIGFSSPYWISYANLDYSMAWFRVVQAFQCIVLIGNGMACMFCLYDNCCRSARKHTRILEIIAGCSGVMGFISVSIYVGKTDNLGSSWNYSWSFALDRFTKHFRFPERILTICHSTPYRADLQDPGSS